MESPNFRMDGRVALITGAGRGIGLGMAQALASAGAAVAIQDIDQDVAEAEAQKINRAGGRAIALGGDIGNVELPKQLVEQTVQRLGGLHVLINNAAIQKRTDWMELTPADMESQLRADFVSPVLLCQQAVAIFRRQRSGRIINMGSIQQQGRWTGMLPYAVSKAALVFLTTSLARELAKDQITVNLLAPGWYNTWRNREDFKTPEDLVERGKHIPLGRIGEPRDCAGITLLLCSDAGSYITGQIIYVDGGMSVR